MKKLILGLSLISSSCIIFGMLVQSKMVLMPSERVMKRELQKHGLGQFNKRVKVTRFAGKPCNVDALKIVLLSGVERFNRNVAPENHVKREDVESVVLSLGVME